MAYVIAEPCIGTKDTACVDACPEDCIHPKKNTTYDDGRPTFDDVPQLYIDPVQCIDCGACVPVCPVSAIFALDDLPEKWKQYTELRGFNHKECARLAIDHASIEGKLPGVWQAFYSGVLDFKEMTRRIRS